MKSRKNRTRKRRTHRRARKNPALFVSRKRRSSHRRSHRRTRRNPSRSRSLVPGLSFNSITSSLNKDTLKTGLGVIGSYAITKKVLETWGPKLPLLAKADGSGPNQPVLLVYNFAIPAIAAALLRKFDPAVARGILVGGMASTLTAAISAYAPDNIKSIVGLGEYLNAPNIPARLPQRGSRINGLNSNASVMSNTGAFDSNWN